MTLIEKHFGAKLRGKTAWITGGKRIGQTVARALAEQGVNVVLSYRKSRAEADRTAALCKKLGVRTLVLQADVGARADVQRAAREIAGFSKRLDILVNMASVYWPVDFEKITQRDWDANIAAHLFGTFWPVQLALPLMPKGAHIVNIADRTSIGRPYRRYIPYIVTKAGVEAFTRAAALELGARGIIVNAIAPGPILPPEGMSPALWKKIRESSPVDLPVSDQESCEQFALLVLYLSQVTMATGFTYALDQGQNLI